MGDTDDLLQPATIIWQLYYYFFFGEEKFSNYKT